jgi:O-antigen biosynthesis protein WbqV
MIRAAGLEPDIDIKIDFVGLRPGEKLFEELFDDSEERLASALPGVFEAEPGPIPLSLLNPILRELEGLAEAGAVEATCRLARSVLAGEAAGQMAEAEPEFFDVWPVHGYRPPALHGAVT